MNLTVITAFLLCSLSWVSVSGSQSQTVEARSDEDVTLSCSNMSKYDSVTFWFRLLKNKNISCIAARPSSTSKAVFCDGYSNKRFSMWSSISTIFLKIQSVEVNDSGLYFCGFYEEGRPSFSVIHLMVRGSDEIQSGTDSEPKKVGVNSSTIVSVILGVVTVLLVNIIIALRDKVRKLQTGVKEGQNSQQYENVDSAGLEKAALTLFSVTDLNTEPGSERGVKTRVIYTAAKKD